jgi:tRNA A-37 threonylcarbamoyl transferase component Bud32
MSELPREGAVLRQKYKLERVVGQGGMALVYAATHLHLQQRVAIKLLRPDVPRENAVVERFVREARAASRLQGAHVARVLDVDTLDDGTPFIVMEHLEGSDLLALAHQRLLPIVDAVGYVREACEAIAEAHTLGIIHRDVKPANLFLARQRTGESNVKVLDFGISKVIEDTRITEEHVGMGSAEYMSPEQMRSATDVDPRSDVWSLGVTLYELCTQHTPFHADGVGAVIAAVLTRAPPPPRQYRPDMPPALEAIILRALEKDPELRYSSVASLSAALAPFGPPPPRASAPSAAGPASAHGAAVPAAPAESKGVPILAFVAGGMAVLIVMIIAFGIGMGSGGKSAKPDRYKLDATTVTDTETKLVWQRHPAPQAMTFAAAEAHCKRAGGGFRLPEIEELRGLVPIFSTDPPIDPEGFTATPIDVFWSATEAGRGAAMVMRFSTASSSTSVVTAQNRVRCVK